MSLTEINEILGEINIRPDEIDNIEVNIFQYTFSS